jgi:hypothetical protein
MQDQKLDLLRALPAITDLLKTETATAWLARHPQPLVAECLRRALAVIRREILNAGSAHAPDTAPPVTADVAS